MEDIENKLKQNNAVSIVQAITKLVQAIKDKKLQEDGKEGKNASDNDIVELRLLKSKCGDENATISVTASQGIVNLVEEGVLLVGSTLSDLILNLSTAKCCSGIIMAIGNLLLVDMRRSLENKKAYKCPFNLQKKQHPLVTVLSQNREIWLDVFSQMQMFVQHFDRKIASNSIELLRPVFFFVLCKPVNKLSDISRRHVWNLLTSIKNTDAQHLAFEILAWIQINTKQDCLDICDYMKELSLEVIRNKNAEMGSVLILYLSSLLVKLIKYGSDPSSYIRTIIDILEKSGTENTHSIVLIMLAETITVSPPLYLKEVLRLCSKIISKRSTNILAVKSVITSLLQWLIYPSSLLNEAHKIARDILNFAGNMNDCAATTSSLFRNNYLKYILIANPQIDVAAKLCCLADKFQSDKSLLFAWIDNLLDKINTNVSKIFTFVSAILINGYDDPTIRQKALKILLQIATKSKEYAAKVIVLIIFLLSQEKDPETQVALLKAVPQMAMLKENVPLVLSILDRTKKESGSLKALSITLYFQVFLTEVRTFPFLQNILLEPSKENEFTIVKAQTLKQICIEKPDLHGKEMVGHLAQILNKHGDQRGGLASALAIDGITALCEADIVDIASTWTSLAPKFTKEKRVLVNNSLCKFFAGFANLRATSKENELLIAEAVDKLWHFVSYSSNITTISLAMKALSNFSPEQIALKQLPDLYRQNLKLPSTYAKTPDEAIRKPEDVLPYIPSECWVQMLQNINHDAMEDAGNLLIDWIQEEISGYRSGIYIVADGKTEPINYNYLPVTSIVGGIGNAIRLHTTGDIKIPLTNAVLMECLRILSQSYTKPLPPLNWCFLHDLIHKDDKIKCLCINLACKQILISGSALRLVENYITSFEPSIEKLSEIKTLFSNLIILCQGVPPLMLRPLLVGSLKVAYDSTVKENNLYDSSLFVILTNDIKKALLNDDIHEANRILIGQTIETFCEQVDGTSKLFDKFLECVVEVPGKYIERISSPSLWWEISQDKFERAVKVRCKVAQRTEKNPLVWLNECINTAATLKSVQTYLLHHIVGVFQEHCCRIDLGDWLLELLGQIQEHLTKKVKDGDQIIYLCDVFLVAVIVLAQHECLISPIDQIIISKETRLSLFPNALLDLIHTNCPNITVQVMEWLHHMVTCPDIPILYQTTFYQSLVLLRHEKAFIESARWMKYMSVKYPN